MLLTYHYVRQVCIQHPLVLIVTFVHLCEVRSEVSDDCVEFIRPFTVGSDA